MGSNTGSGMPGMSGLPGSPAVIPVGSGWHGIPGSPSGYECTGIFVVSNGDIGGINPSPNLAAVMFER